MKSMWSRLELAGIKKGLTSISYAGIPRWLPQKYVIVFQALCLETLQRPVLPVHLVYSCKSRLLSVIHTRTAVASCSQIAHTAPLTSTRWSRALQE